MNKIIIVLSGTMVKNYILKVERFRMNIILTRDSSKLRDEMSSCNNKYLYLSCNHVRLRSMQGHLMQKRIGLNVVKVACTESCWWLRFNEDTRRSERNWSMLPEDIYVILYSSMSEVSSMAVQDLRLHCRRSSRRMISIS